MVNRGKRRMTTRMFRISFKRLDLWTYPIDWQFCKNLKLICYWDVCCENPIKLSLFHTIQFIKVGNSHYKKTDPNQSKSSQINLLFYNPSSRLVQPIAYDKFTIYSQLFQLILTSQPITRQPQIKRHMDREPITGNRVVCNHMQERERKRLKERLKIIKQNRSQYSSVGLIKEKPRANSLFLQKNQQIEKQNIALFNRIASIIKKNPKIQTQSQLSLQKSRQTSTLFYRKIQSSLEEQNKIIQKRLSSQKPTINNKLFYQQRAQHMRYLKTMSRYPYILNKKVNTEPDVNAFDDVNINHDEFPPISNIKSEFNKLNDNGRFKELFKHQSLDFTILVSMDMKTDMCTFSIQTNQSNPETYVLNIPKPQFIQYFEQSEYDYEKMIGNLRLNDEGNIDYIRDKENKISNTSNQEKQIFKFKAQSTAYTSTGFKTGFRSNKRNNVSKVETEHKGNSKTDRKITKYNLEEKPERTKEADVLSENKFSEINLIAKNQ